MKLAGQIGLIALVALAITLLPGGGTAVEVVLTALTIAFLVVIGFLGFRLFHQFRFELESLEDRDRAVLYGSIALAIFTFAAARADVRRRRRRDRRVAGPPGHRGLRPVLGLDPVPPAGLTALLHLPVARL